MATDSPVKVYENQGVLQGQPQAQPADVHDGRTVVHEVVVHTDKHILDPNDPLAVQVPEGVGASTVGAAPALSSLANGTAEEQFARASESEAEKEGKSPEPAPEPKFTENDSDENAEAEKQGEQKDSNTKK